MVPDDLGEQYDLDFVPLTEEDLELLEPEPEEPTPGLQARQPLSDPEIPKRESRSGPGRSGSRRSATPGRPVRTEMKPEEQDPAGDPAGDPEINPEINPEIDPEMDPAIDPAIDPGDPDQWKTLRALFETRLRDIPRDQRVGLARSAEEPALSAFCFDPDPGVIRSVMENAMTGLDHARLIAAHHWNGTGLLNLANRREFIADAHVQRLLLRNPQLPELLFQRVMGRKPMLELYLTWCSREVSERSRASIRELLRRRFAEMSSAESRVELLFATQGRVLTVLSGMRFDVRTVALLCTRAYPSALLIQNLARFPSTPANLLVHLYRQPIVKRQARLAKLLLQHPNMPAGIKH